MVDALTSKGDEGRGVAAIRPGEVRSNRRSGDLRMGEPFRVNRGNLPAFLDFCLWVETPRVEGRK